AERRLHCLSFFRHCGPSSRRFPRFSRLYARTNGKNAIRPRDGPIRWLQRGRGIWAVERPKLRLASASVRGRSGEGLRESWNSCDQQGHPCAPREQVQSGALLMAIFKTGGIAAILTCAITLSLPLEYAKAQAVGPAVTTTLNPRGAWSSSASYVANDLVTLRNSSWRALRASKGKLPGQTLPST